MDFRFFKLRITQKTERKIRGVKNGAQDVKFGRRLQKM